MSGLERPEYRADIDGLRALAVLAVMGFHAFPEAVPGGFTGVDVFFVVSGFLISTIVLENLERGRFSFATFYARRARRIFPALAVVLFAALALGWAALFADELAQLGKHAAAGAGFVANLVLWSEAGYFDNAADTKPLLHLWSLGVEEQFYLVWPALLWIGWRVRTRLAGAIAAVGLLSFALCVWLAAQDTVAAFYAPFTRLWELVLGAWLACRALQAPSAAPPRFADLRAWVGMALILFGLAAISRETLFPGAWTLAPTLGAFLLISAGPGAWLNARVLSARPLVGIGLISYPLYLWHWPLLSFARIVEGATPDASVRSGALLASFLLAWGTYAWIERPVRFGSRPRTATTLVCLFMLVAGGAGYACFTHDGFAERPAARLQSLNRFDFSSYRQDCRWVAGVASRDDFCNAGNQPSVPPAILLVGDSFGGAFAPMVESTLHDLPGPRPAFRQIGHELCPLLLDFGPPACRERARRAMAYVRATPSVRLVVLASRWPIYDGGNNLEWGRHVEPPEAFDAAFRRTVAELRAAGKTVVVFLSPPGGSFPKACVVRPLRLTAEDHCSLALAVARHYDGVYRARMLPRLRELSVPYFDPFPYLCTESACRVTDGERILWADRFHLSAFGAQFLAAAARPQLVELLRSGR